MRNRFLSLIFAVVVLAMSPLAAMAEDLPPYDARLVGYSGKNDYTLDGGGEALLWLLLIALMILALSVLFKNAKRSHLD